MKHRLKELFHIPKEGRLSEKTLLARLTLSVIAILLCLAALTSGAYALFNYGVTTDENVIVTVVHAP